MSMLNGVPVLVRSVLLLALGGLGCGKTQNQAVGTDAGDGGSVSCVPVKTDDSGSLCSGTGRLSCSKPSLSCPRYDTAPVTIGITTTAYEGSLPKCAAADIGDALDGRGFSFPVRVELVQEKIYPMNGADQLETWVHLAKTDASPECGLLANFRSLSERPHVEAGMRLRFSARAVGDSQTDLRRVDAISSDRGDILYALTQSVAPASFERELGDLLPGLSIATEGQALCKDTGGGEGLRVLLKGGDDSCSVDSQTSRCCELFGKDYEVEMLSAISSTATREPRVSFALRQKGFFSRP